MHIILLKIKIKFNINTFYFTLIKCFEVITIAETAGKCKKCEYSEHALVI